MNLLGLVFSILLILSFGFYACLEKRALLQRIDKSFIGQTKTVRSLQARYEKESFKQLSAQKKTPREKKEPLQKAKQKTHEVPKPPKINPECARLNLWPLVEKGAETHPFLYEQTASLLRQFYKAPLFNLEKTGFEYKFLDAWLSSVKAFTLKKSKEPVILEKIALQDPALQRLYYKMLRGGQERYPSLLDFMKVEQRGETKICLLHATPQLLSLFFGTAAQAVYNELHAGKALVTEEMIEEVCRNHQVALLDKQIFALLEVGRPRHKHSTELTLYEEDSETHISLRKKVYVPKS